MAALETQRAVLGDAVVDAALVGLRAKLAPVQPAPPPEPAQNLKQVSAVMDGASSRGTAIVGAHHDFPPALRGNACNCRAAPI